MRRPFLAALIWSAALAAPAHAADARWIPEEGTRAYRYESNERVAGTGDRGYRLDYDLVSDGKGRLVAVVLAAQRLEAGKLIDVALDEACRAKLHASPGELARVTLAPVAPEVARTLGPQFIDGCAPMEIFSPITEILNVTRIQVAPEFQLAALAAPGDSRRFAAFSSHADRPDQVVDLEVPGGTTRFASATGTRATIEWIPDTAALRLVARPGGDGPEVHGEGSGQFAMRLEIDRATGVLLGASSQVSRADMVLDIKDAPPIPITVTREINIVPRAR